MSNRITWEDLVAAVQRQFQHSAPNGWLLGWDRNRGFALVCTAAAPHQTTNHSSFDFGFCNWYEVCVNGNTDQCFWSLTIKLSFILPIYCIYWTRYESSIKGSVIDTAPTGYQVVEDNVRVAVENAGFFELPDDWYERKIDGVELELSGNERVTLGKCLFTDYEG